jgi:hypothetical protein
LVSVGIGPVSAATPLLTTSWTVIPTKVKGGEYVAFRAQITNDDSSTVSQLFLLEKARDPNLTLVPTSISISGSAQGSCNTTGATFNCTLGQLKPHKTIKVAAVFSTAAVTSPATGYSATESWEFNTVGLGSGGGDNSHGDKWPSTDADGNPLLVAQVTSDPDFGGRYVLNTNLLVVENSQAINNTNRHSTRAYSPGSGIGVTVEDVDCSAQTPDPICDLFTTGTSAISKVNVNDGKDISGTAGTTLLHFYLQADSSEIPGVGSGSAVVTHVYFDEATQKNVTETISTRCTFAKKSPTTPTNAPCITVTNLGGGDLGVDVWTFHNGGMRL